MRRLALSIALLSALLAAPALAQSPPISAQVAPTAPTATNNNQIASTAWVRNFIAAGGVVLVSGTGHGDSIYSIASTDRYVYTNAAFTAPRVWTLPAANSLAAGTTIWVQDAQGTVTTTNTLTVSRAGADTIDVANTTLVITGAGGGITFTTDGVSNWGTPIQTASTGGTGQKTLTNHGVLIGAGLNPITQLPVATNGQLLVGQTGADPAWTNPSIVVQTFTATGTYTPTAGMLHAIVECLGPGGGGGGAAGTAGGIFIAGGGSPGSFSRKRIAAADIVTNAAITLPAGGAGGTAGANAGSNGAGDTTVISNAVSLCVGKTGLGGGAASNTLVAQGGAAAPTGTGDLTANGNPGGPGYFNSANITAVLPAGQGGSGPFGGGAAATFCANTATAGAAAGNYGSGGAGACASNTASTAAGGAGSKGIVIITEYVNL